MDHESSEYEHKGNVSACNSGFHACENPFDIFKYYNVGGGNRFAQVEQSGDISKENSDSKIASRKIKINIELKLPGLIKAGFEYIHKKTFDLVKNPTSGYNSHSATSGDNSNSATSGKYSNSATSGDNSQASAEETAIAASIGLNAKAKGGVGCWIVLSEWKEISWNERELICVKTTLVDGIIIKANVYYKLINGEFTEVKSK